MTTIQIPVATPQPVGGGFPSPGAVTAPSGALPGSVPGAPFRFYIGPAGGTATTEITALVFTATWRHGSQAPNRVGQVAQPAEGNIVLDRPEWWSPFNPHPSLPTYPGAVVRITNAAGDDFFTGWSRGVVSASAPVAGGRPDTSIMPIYGRLARISEFNDGIFAKVTEPRVSVGDAFRLASQQAEQADNVIVRPESPLVLLGPALNASGVLSSGRNFVNVLSAYETLATAEGGYIYDDREGNIIFETSRHRLMATNAGRQITVLPENVEQLDANRLVVNIIASESTQLAARGTSTLAFTTELPATITVPPGRTAGIILEVSPTSFVEAPTGILAPFFGYLNGLVNSMSPQSSVVIIESVEQLVSPGDYTYTGPAPDVQVEEKRVVINFTNPTAAPLTATVKQVRGETARPSGGLRVYARNSPSVDVYGPKSAQYPFKIIVGEGDGVQNRQAYAQQKIDHWVAAHGGVDADGRPNPLYPVKATWSVDTPTPIDISDLALLTWVTPEVQHVRDYPMWVDAVEWSYDSDGKASVECLLRPTVAATVVEGVELPDVPVSIAPPTPGSGGLVARLAMPTGFSEVARLAMPTGFSEVARLAMPTGFSEVARLAMAAPQRRIRRITGAGTVDNARSNSLLASVDEAVRLGVVRRAFGFNDIVGVQFAFFDPAVPQYTPTGGAAVDVFGYLLLPSSRKIPVIFVVGQPTTKAAAFALANAVWPVLRDVNNESKQSFNDDSSHVYGTTDVAASTDRYYLR